MAKQFLDTTGLATFYTQLKGLFATKNAVSEVKTNTDDYVLNIDYSQIAFDTTEIVTEEGEQ